MKRPCCHPVWITVPDFTKGNYLGTSKKKRIKVPCRKCVNCNYNYQREWMFRLICETYVSETTYFITLTMDDEHLVSLNKSDVQLFIRMVRQHFNRLCDKYNLDHFDLRYYAVGEYGKRFNRPHYHLLLFNLPFHDKHLVYNELKRFWKKGFIYVEDCNLKRIGYITKYITKYDLRDHEVAPFRLMSLRPPLGIKYFDDRQNLLFLQSVQKPVMRLKNGFVYIIPYFIRKKFFTESQKDNLRSYYDRPFNFDYEYCKNTFREQKRLEDFDRKMSERLSNRFYV